MKRNRNPNSRISSLRKPHLPLHAELLEPRLVLAAANVFASFDGVITSNANEEIEIALSADDFQFRGDDALFGFHVTAANGSGLDPAPIEVRRHDDIELVALLTIDDINDGVGSLVLVELGHGDFQLLIGGEDGTSGDYNVDVFLAGDTDGNLVVDRNDLNAIRTSFGSTVVNEGFIPAADINMDGRISSFDLFQWRRNSDDGTAIRPMELSVSLSVNETTLAGTAATITDTDRVVVSGQTSPSSIVEVDIGNDGQFDQTLNPDEAGEFTFDFGFEDVGAREVFIQSRDGFGQTNQTNVSLDVIESFRITEMSPAAGESLVSTTRDVVVRFSEEADASTVNSESLKVIALGQEVTGRWAVSEGTRRFATFYVDGSWPASTEVRVQANGDMILAANGDALDADEDGIPGGEFAADFRTVPMTRIPGTNVTGRIVASERDTFGNDVPLGGVTVRVDGFEDFTAVTDENGYFTLIETPAPVFFVHIDGSTTTTVGGQPVPDIGFYPNVGKPFHSTPGRTVELSHHGVLFDVHLPFILDEAIHVVEAGRETIVGLPGSQTEDDERLNLLQLTVPPDSLRSDTGEPGTEVGIFRVDSDRLPAPLPSNLDHIFDITVQADVDNFDVPAPITFPNLDPNLNPGDQAYLMSFDHALGEWVVVGTMSVSDDGETITTDPGVGVRAPGWHGVQNGSQASGNGNSGNSGGGNSGGGDGGGGDGGGGDGGGGDGGGGDGGGGDGGGGDGGGGDGGGGDGGGGDGGGGDGGGGDGGGGDGGGGDGGGGDGGKDTGQEEPGQENGDDLPADVTKANDNVKVDNLDSDLRDALSDVADAVKKTTDSDGVKLSSGNDKKHKGSNKPGTDCSTVAKCRETSDSKHYDDEAVDISSWKPDYSKRFKKEELKAIAEEICNCKLDDNGVGKWDRDNDGTVDFEVIHEFPGKEPEQHIHIEKMEGSEPQRNGPSPAKALSVVPNTSDSSR